MILGLASHFSQICQSNCSSNWTRLFQTGGLSAFTRLARLVRLGPVTLLRTPPYRSHRYQSCPACRPTQKLSGCVALLPIFWSLHWRWLILDVLHPWVAPKQYSQSELPNCSNQVLIDYHLSHLPNQGLRPTWGQARVIIAGPKLSSPRFHAGARDWGWRGDQQAGWFRFHTAATSTLFWQARHSHVHLSSLTAKSRIFFTWARLGGFERVAFRQLFSPLSRFGVPWSAWLSQGTSWHGWRLLLAEGDWMTSFCSRWMTIDCLAGWALCLGAWWCWCRTAPRQDTMVSFIRSCMTSILRPFGETVDELQRRSAEPETTVVRRCVTCSQSCQVRRNAVRECECLAHMSWWILLMLLHVIALFLCGTSRHSMPFHAVFLHMSFYPNARVLGPQYFKTQKSTEECRGVGGQAGARGQHQGLWPLRCHALTEALWPMILSPMLRRWLNRLPSSAICGRIWIALQMRREGHQVCNGEMHWNSMKLPCHIAWAVACEAAGLANTEPPGC